MPRFKRHLSVHAPLCWTGLLLACGARTSDDVSPAPFPSSFATALGGRTAADISGGTTARLSGGSSSLITGGTGSMGGSATAITQPDCRPGAARFATRVVDHAFGGGQDFNQTLFPAPLFGPPAANQPRSVVSLGNGGFVTLAFDGNAIIDGPGVDFTVFENPLPRYRELATVAVSDDGTTWFEYPCTAGADDEDPGACAGVQLVYSSGTNGIDPLDPNVSGGDQYDLATIGVHHARYVRITDRVDLIEEVFDLDAVAIVHAECR